MKNIKYLFLFFLMNCSISKVITDYDEKIDFSEYKTYHFFENSGEGLNALDINRIRSAIHIEMKNLGFTLNDNPDIFIDFSSKISELENNNIIGVNIGNSTRNGGFGISGGIPIGGNKLVEEITIDFVTSKKEELIWQGILKSKIKEKRTPEEKEIQYSKIINQILMEFLKIKA